MINIHNVKSYKILFILFFIGSIHTIIFGFLTEPENFLLIDVSRNWQKSLTFTFYLFAIITACINHVISRNIGLKKTLILGLYSYLIGMLTFFISHLFTNYVFLLNNILFLGMILLGFAFSSVTIALFTYTTLEFRKHLEIGVTILSIFMNIGALLSPIFINVFNSWNRGWLFALVLCMLILLSIQFIKTFFFDPIFPKHLEHLRKSSVIWKEMHYRLALFIIAMIFYGFCENTFNLFGDHYMSFYFSEKLSHEYISIFWLFLIIGQILILIPLYLTSPKKVLSFVIGLILLAFILLPHQKTIVGITFSLALAGLGCSICFPVLLGILESELKASFISKPHSHLLPYMEICVALLIAGYIVGVGFITLLMDSFSKITLNIVVSNIYAGIGYGAMFILIALFLTISSRKTKLN